MALVMLLLRGIFALLPSCHNNNSNNIIGHKHLISINVIRAHIFFFFWLFVFLGLHPSRHMEVPRLGIQLELQLLACTTATATSDLSCICDLHHSSWQHWILDPLSKARDGTHNFMVPSRICFRCTTTETPGCTSCAVVPVCADTESWHIVKGADP